MNDYTSVMATIAAIVLAIIAVFNYRSRPILIRSFERHTNDLREILSQWLDQLPNAPKPKDIDDIVKTMRQPNQIAIEVENRFLFDDLPNHEPKNWHVLDHWNKHKSDFNNYNQRRFRIVEDIHKIISKLSDLPFDLTSPYRINPNATNMIYNHLFNIVNNFPSSYWRQTVEGLKITPHEDKFTLHHDYEGTMAFGTQQEMSRVQTVLVKMIEDLPKTIGTELYSSWSEHIRELISRKKSLDEYRNKLLNEINNLKLIPLFTQRCKYIKI